MSIEPVSAPSPNQTRYQQVKQKFVDFSNSKPLEKFHSAVKNTADMNDTILVPRTIFKGYLGIMAGTTLVTAGSLLNKALPKISKALTITGLISSLYGTYAFVRPYVIKDAPGVLTKKPETN